MNISKINISGVDYNLTDKDAQSKIVALTENTYTKSDVDELVSAIDDKVDGIDLTPYETIEGAAGKYQPKGEYLTEHQSLDNYYTKEESDDKYITEHQSLAEYAKKSELYDDSELSGRVEVLEAIDHSKYLTAHQDISNLATKAEVKAVADSVDEIVIPTNVSEFTNDAGYLTEHQSLSDYYNKGEVDNMLSSKATTVALEGVSNMAIANENRIDAIEKAGYATETYVDGKIADLINDAPETLDTLKEIADAIEANEDVVTALNSAIGSKANSADVYTKAEVDSAIEGVDVSDQLSSYVTTEVADATYQPKGEYLTEHQSLDNYYNKTESDNKYQVKGDYLTEHQSLEGYVTDEELESKGYLTEHQSLAEYAKKSELYDDTELSERIDALEGINHSQYLTEHQSLANYYNKSEVDTAVGSKANSADVYTKAESDAKYQPVGDYLTEHQSLDNYYTKTDIDNKGYLTLHQDLSQYAKKSELYDDSDLVERVETLEAIDHSVYLTEHLDISGKADKSYVDTKIADLVNGAPETLDTLKELADAISDNSDVAEALTEAIGNKANAADVYTKTESDAKYQPVGNYLTEHQDISTLATKAEVNAKANSADVYTKSEVDTALSGKADSDHTHSQYLTEHQSLADYALKSELYDDTALKGRVATLEAIDHSQYLTEHQDISGKVDKEEGKGLSSNDYTTAEKNKLAATPLFWVGTQSEYDAITQKDNNTFYYIVEE